MIDLKGRDKADVLAKLYNASRPLGMGFLHFDPKPMTTKEARTILDGGQTYFDYLKGRVMKVDLSKDTLDPWLYDRDNGQGAAERAICANAHPHGTAVAGTVQGDVGNDLEQETHKSQPDDLPLRSGAIGAGEAVEIQRPTAAPLPVSNDEFRGGCKPSSGTSCSQGEI